jgi:hypothetical protein
MYQSTPNRALSSLEVAVLALRVASQASVVPGIIYELPIGELDRGPAALLVPEIHGRGY